MEALDRVTELSVLYEISAIPTRLTELDQIGALVVDKAIRLLGSDVAILYLHRPEAATLRPQASRGVLLARLTELPLASIGQAVARVIAGKRPLSWRRGDSVAMAELLGVPYTVQAAICAPVRTDDELLGLIYAARLKDRPFTASEQSLFSVLADRTASAIANLRLLKSGRRRAMQLQTAAEVSRAVSSILDPEALIPQLVDLVRERFGLYYAGLFLVDHTGEWTGEPSKWAVLQAGTGEAGRQMLKQGHKLEIGGASMIGWCIANKQARIALDVGQEATRFKNPLLPETRSELALPLIGRGRPIGALTIQSDQEIAFSEEDVAALQTMADQMANAIANARLYDQAHREINERKRTAEALQESETRLRTIVDSLQVGIVIIDAETHTIVDANPVAIGMISAPKENIIGHVCHKFVCPAEEGQCPITDLGQAVDKAERVLVNVNGESIPILKTVTPIMLSGRNHLMESFLDITERRQAEEALQKAHENLAQYTENLERRTAQLQVGAEVAREATAILDVQQLLNTAVRLISERFGFYHAGAFLIDEPGEYAVLRAASSEGGDRMLARGHRLPVGKLGIVGYVAATGQPRIALDVGQDAVFFDNPDLPNTRSEMGLPLKVRGRNIGVLDVQDTQEAAFSEDDVVVLRTLADQLAVAVDNARLMERTETQLRELSLLYGEYAASTWAELASPDRSLGYVYDRIDVVAAETLPASALDLALTRGETITLSMPDTTEKVLATPLKLRDQIIGTLGIQETDGGREWSPSEIALVEAVSEQVAQALESAQLFADAQQRGREQEGLARIAALAGSTLDIDELLAQLVEETVQLLGAQIGVLLVLDEDEKALVDRYLSSRVRLRMTPGEWRVPLDTPGFEQSIFSRGGDYYTNQAQTDPNVLPTYRSYVKALGAENFCGAALRVRDRSVGELYVADRPGGFGPEQARLLRTVTGYAANAIENARLFEETQQRAGQWEALTEVGQAIGSILDLDEVLQLILEQLKQVIPYDTVALWLREEETMCIRAGRGFEADIGLAVPIQEDALFQELVSTQRPLTITDAQQDERFRSLADTEWVRSWLGVPLLSKEEVIGLLTIDNREPGLYTAEMAELALTFGHQAAMAIENARLFEETQRRTVQLQAASEVARDATSILDVDQLLDETVHLISEQFKFYHAGVFLLDDRGAYAVLRAASSEGGRRMLARSHKLPVGKIGIVGNVAATGEPHIALDVGQDAVHFVNVDLPDTRSEMGLPLKVRGQVIGVLDVQSTQEAAFSDEDVAVLQTLADQLAAAIANARLFQEVRADATRRALINEVQQAAVASLNPDELLHQAGEVISRRLEAPSAIFIWKPEERVLRPIAIHDATAGDVPLPEGMVITREMNPILFETVEKRRARVMETPVALSGPLADVARQLKIQSAVYVPLISRDRVMGALSLCQVRGRPSPTSEDVGFAEIIAGNLSVALENAHLYQDALETAEQLKEIDRLKSQFLANMSHELRTPLNSIIGFSRVILKGIDGPLTDMQRTDLEAVYNSGQHLLGLINDILDISKIQAGKMEISLEDTDLHEVIKGVMSTAIALIKNKPVELQQIVPPDLPIIRADTRRIRQVLLNVIGNSAKFTDEGFIRVEAKAVSPRVGESPTEVVVTITDSGIGIPPDKIDTIFEEFTQVDGSSTRAVGGTGLGLPISKKFVEMHSGRIWVESTVDAGSTIYIALPIASPSEEVSVEVDKVDEEKVEEIEKDERRVVLCVDDDEGVILLFRRYLSQQGYRVVGLTESTAVVERARQLNPFAITLDVMMPGKDGWQVIQELKSDPDTHDIPVIICSIVSEKDYGISLGASDYLVKPILESDLVTALERSNQKAGHHRVLVVDDHPEDRSLLRRMVESQEGYQVIEAAGGQEAISLVKQVQPHIIILDLMMPEIDGFAVLESVKADKTTRSIPIIVVTAKDLTQEERNFLNRRVEALLKKGIFEQEELLADVAAVLERIAITNDK